MDYSSREELGMVDIFDEKLLPRLVEIEGGYVNHPSDRGGETNHGITVAVARANGYTGPMRDMPRSVAERIYKSQYWLKPKFDHVANISVRIAEELFDTGVNAGQGTAAKFLQRALNGFNRQQRDYPDITVDSDIGPATLRALGSFFAKNGKKAELRLLRLLECQQGAFYLSLAQNREKNEDFLNGWIDNRISLS